MLGLDGQTYIIALLVVRVVLSKVKDGSEWTEKHELKLKRDKYGIPD